MHKGTLAGRGRESRPTAGHRGGGSQWCNRLPQPQTGERASVGRTVRPQERRTDRTTLFFFVVLFFVLGVLLFAAGEARAQGLTEAPDPGAGQSPEATEAASAPPVPTA